MQDYMKNLDLPSCTVGKLQGSSVTQILREIKVGEYVESQNLQFEHI